MVNVAGSGGVEELTLQHMRSAQMRRQAVHSLLRASVHGALKQVRVEVGMRVEGLCHGVAGEGVIEVLDTDGVTP